LASKPQKELSLKVTKINAARSQLESAIEFYFSYGDEVTIHTLASASLNVLTDLCQHLKVVTPLHLEGMLNDLVKPEHHKMFRNKIREPENFFKHADREHFLQECIDAFKTPCKARSGLESCIPPPHL